MDDKIAKLEKKLARAQRDGDEAAAAKLGTKLGKAKKRTAEPEAAPAAAAALRPPAAAALKTGPMASTIMPAGRPPNRKMDVEIV